MNVYQIPDTEAEKNNQIPSLAYVLSLFIQLENKFIQHENDSNAHIFNNVKTDLMVPPKEEIIDLPISNKLPDEGIDIDNLNLDSNHKLISETQISIFKDKVSKPELDSRIMDLRNELKIEINKFFDKLFNTTESINKLKQIFELLNLKENKEKFDLLISKISQEEFNNHIESPMHLDNNDRKALNQLIKFIHTGCADWEADCDAPNYIKNKPTSLPADGGDANTISGFGIDDLYNTRFEDYIIGIASEDEDIDGTNIILYKNKKDDEEYSVKWFFNIIKENAQGIYSFKDGLYVANDIDLNYNNHNKCKSIIINGKGIYNTKFRFKSIKINAYVNFRDILFCYSNIIINGNASFDNVRFDNCNIIFNSCTNISITNCIFEFCKFSFNGNCDKMIITNNKIIGSMFPAYYGINNIITNNLFI